jgi:hypothetical protein
VIINGLSEDVHHWSSYGYDSPLGIGGGASRGYRTARALESESNREADDVFAMAGSMDR